MNIHIVLIAYALDITPLVFGLDGSDITWHIYAHSNRAAVLDAYNQFGGIDNIRFHNYGTNRGLARSWSDGIAEAREQGADVIVVVNDDVTMQRADLVILASAAVQHREAGIIVAEGFNERMNEQQILGYAVFAINPVAIDTVGYFDEVGYWPIYGEDVDYSRRCALLGVTFHNAGRTGIIHQGSATVGAVPELRAQDQVTFPRNHAYHVAKHGGGYNQEVYTHPFNDSALSWKITAEDRHNPYPGHERGDYEIVKL